ncbi:hypothetical protein B0T10DRAFT_552733 [Thelonectria olida]|uniref:Uncharacterized protein n=1 Tax=Thelonectria olida TaxID=1576542 RepID=A0A9P9AJL6_9HYPO|nr:hypothetical protein B0T10DRAFT_552733 [Thelonectria olida]
MLLKSLAILFSVSVVNAASVANLTATGCADSSGLQTCLDKVASTSQKCLDSARKDGSQLETVACGCVYYTENINCYAAHCWNRVYECEYQKYVIQYLGQCDSAKLPLPYFPAPDGAKDACSCNLGKVYEQFLESVTEGGTCASSNARRDALDQLDRVEACECCEMSGGLSAIYGVCPDTDPALVGLSYIEQLESLYDLPFTSCDQYMSSYDCKKDLGFTAASTFYDPSDLPSSGSATLSNGPGSVTAPASGTVFTYTNAADSQVYTISAASARKGSGSGSDSTATAASAGASAKATDGSKDSGSSSRPVSMGLGTGLVVLAWAVTFTLA